MPKIIKLIILGASYKWFVSFVFGWGGASTQAVARKRNIINNNNLSVNGIRVFNNYNAKFDGPITAIKYSRDIGKFLIVDKRDVLEIRKLYGDSILPQG